MPFVSRVLAPSALVFALLLTGCASPQEKVAKCQSKCSKFKVDMVINICKGRCESEVYGEMDEGKLEKLCGEGDAIACLRFATKAGSGRADAVAAKLQGCCDGKKVAKCCGFLGKMYSRGKVLKTDKPKGYALMEQACGMGDTTSCTSPGLQHMTKGAYDKALKLFKTGCDADAKNACGLLGVLYRDGKGVPADTAKARTLMDKACRLGSSMSCKAVKRLR